MFTTNWWRPGTTLSDEGFSITLVSRTALIYRIDGKSMIVTTEGAGKYIDVFHSSMNHWQNDNSPVDGKTDKRNVENVSRALESRGLTVRIVT